jgi:hypothetical protein
MVRVDTLIDLPKEELERLKFIRDGVVPQRPERNRAEIKYQLIRLRCGRTVVRRIMFDDSCEE